MDYVPSSHYAVIHYITKRYFHKRNTSNTKICCCKGFDRRCTFNLMSFDIIYIYILFNCMFLQHILTAMQQFSVENNLVIIAGVFEHHIMQTYFWNHKCNFCLRRFVAHLNACCISSYPPLLTISAKK